MNVGHGNARLRERFRDPIGWLMDALPWRLRRYLVAWRMRVRPSNVPDSVEIIAWRRPPEWVFKSLRRLEGLE